MYMYRLKRSTKLDKNGRPAIVLDFFGEESLIWWGTTVLSKTAKDKPIVIKLGNKSTYFYNKGLEKVKTNFLVTNWKNFKTHKRLVLSEVEERNFISKFVLMTNQIDPYEKIYLLELENQMLHTKINTLKQEKENFLILLQQQEFERQ